MRLLSGPKISGPHNDVGEMLRSGSGPETPVEPTNQGGGGEPGTWDTSQIQFGVSFSALPWTPCVSFMYPAPAVSVGHNGPIPHPVKQTNAQVVFVFFLG